MSHNDSRRDRWLTRLINLLAVLPLSILYLMADALFLMLFYVARYQRKLVTDNLRNAFPAYSTKTLHKLARQNYRNTAQVLFEIIKSNRLNREQLIKRARCINPSVVLNHLENGQDVLILTAHQCNWEWPQLACSALFDYPAQVVYKPLNHPQLDTLLTNIRSRFGSQMVPVGNSRSELLKRNTKSKMIVMVADLGPRRDEKQDWHTFLGRNTAFYPGPRLIARRLNIPVFFASVTRARRGFYEIYFEPLSSQNSDENIMSSYIRRLEKSITANPADWLWMNKRWKYTQQEIRQ